MGEIVSFRKKTHEPIKVEQTWKQDDRVQFIWFDDFEYHGRIVGYLDLGRKSEYLILEPSEMLPDQTFATVAVLADRVLPEGSTDLYPFRR